MLQLLRQVWHTCISGYLKYVGLGLLVMYLLLLNTGKELKNAVYCRLCKVEKFHNCHGNHETFPVK